MPPTRLADKARARSAKAIASLRKYGFGEGDGFALIEAPDNVKAAGLALAITSSGAFRKFETTVLMTQKELLEALQVAADVHYVAPAEAVHA